MIESAANAQVKKIKKLKKSAKFRRQENCFLVEGFKMVEEALRYRKAQIVYVASGAKEECYERLSKQLSEVTVEEVADGIFAELADTETPQGILALVQIPSYPKEELFSGERAAVVCLEDIQDPGNLGTIMRTAEGAGMSAVIMTKGCVDICNPKTVRSTMGAMFRMPFYVVDSLVEEMKELKQQGFSFYSAQLDGSVPYTEPDYQGKVGILIGNEAKGIRKETGACADCRIHIPMEGEVESLNAGVSAAILMYELHRKYDLQNH